MDIRKELELAGAADLANDVWEGVNAPDGLVAYARGWLALGQEQLRFLGKYRFWDEETNTSLETDVRRLRTAIFQREQTADEIIEAVASEIQA
jgi:hypothetical protein